MLLWYTLHVAAQPYNKQTPSCIGFSDRQFSPREINSKIVPAPGKNIPSFSSYNQPNLAGLPVLDGCLNKRFQIYLIWDLERVCCASRIQDLSAMNNLIQSTCRNIVKPWAVEYYFRFDSARLYKLMKTLLPFFDQQSGFFSGMRRAIFVQ